MITLNNRKLCENCFSETTIVPCPHCGFAKMSYRQDPIALAIGSVLNQRYMIGGVIGKGGFGITYLAYDLKLDARLAVKEYYPMGLAIRNPGTTIVSVSNEESQESFRTGAEKFYNEAKMVARFNGNPNIVSVHDFFYENETVYFTMGYLQGQTLKSYLKKKKVTEGQAVNVLKGISSALMASHSMNILHRDISPDNIMLCDDGSIRLLDFGAARQVMAEQSQSLSVILKQGFAPLEQYQKKGKQGPWTDIYALGATVYTALTGEMLSDPMSRLEDDFDFESNKHGISDGLWNIIRKCTQLKITDRYQNVSELKEDIKALGIEIEPFTDVDEEIMDLLRSRGGKGPGNTAPGTSADNAASSDPNATVLLSGQSEEMPADPNAGSWNSTVNMPGQPVTGGYTGQPVTGQQAAVPPATG
ncbi:MAG: serine/threonine protein kinase [Lachnospiraceae bacterium]|nr:serine/threonine protein kinase [Lachnospiraceae bacterium]